MDLRRIGSSFIGKSDSYFRAGVLAIALSFTANISIAQDYAKQNYDKGFAAYQRGDYRAAYKIFLPLAEQGYSSAQFNLGVMYDYGKGVLADDREAVKWYVQAALQGFANAQFNLGHMLDDGKGVLRDNREAVKYFRLAANQGHTKAQFVLGDKYDKGNGVLTDRISAHMWFSLADYTGNGAARARRDAVEKKMSAADISNAAKSARDCLNSDYKNCR